MRYLFPSLYQYHGVVTGMELSPGPEISNQVACDNIGGHKVIWGVLSWIRKRQPCLLDRESSEPLSWVFLLLSLKNHQQ